ncbi:hypothetical protein C7S20_07835 [Christiangramia fulva]|uniref:Uncharacterized protein n=1 Tax=Christiangramia fulva TaxID=2126553 RepID=A0A2R3Z4N2_9FLAO|nr:DUF6730 family protein [Christiangramia fulva]AVR45188.1 hypothetical protein C7S20_07835 [Christiangramia fulva]
MAKVEELMALMIDEINRYEQLIKKMEKLQQQKIEIDVIKLEEFLKAHENQMEQSRNILEKFHRKMEKLMEDANVYPKWAVIVFIISLLINCGLIFYIIILL